MNGARSGPVANALSDCEDRLVQADEPLATMQRSCGGDLPGPIAIPALREVVAKARAMRLRLSRPLRLFDGEFEIRAWVVVGPRDDGEAGCQIALSNWQSEPGETTDRDGFAGTRDLIDSATAELRARLDAEQRILTVQSGAPDLAALRARMQVGTGRAWTDFVALPASPHVQPLHWRLLDRATCQIDGSPRTWTARLLPIVAGDADPTGFELLLVADRAWIERREDRSRTRTVDANIVANELTPVLRQPISRIIANAETIRSRLAGPLGEEYTGYAADIAVAGQHLLSLVDDLADLEIVEAAGFETAPDRIRLTDVARRTAGILGVRAQERDITLRVPPEVAGQEAIGEFRRVLQVLLNLVGNAIKYSPAGSIVDIAVGTRGDTAYIAVRDRGDGLDQEQQAKVFEKFERLDRRDDGGSGLGLYISRRLARAMGGDLHVQSERGKGAIFSLTLPKAPPD